MKLNEQLNRMKSLMGIKENYEINELSPETMINATNKAYDKGEFTRSGNFISHVGNQNFQELKGKPFFGGVIYEVQLVKGMCRLVYKVENETEYFYYNMD